MGDETDVAPPRTPPRVDAGTWNDADGSPLPTPPRVSHVYDATEESWPHTPHALRPTQGPALQTPGLSATLRASTLATSQRSVGRGLQKLRTWCN